MKTKSIIFDLDNTLIRDGEDIRRIKKLLKKIQKDFVLILLTNSSSKVASKKIKMFNLESIFDKIVYRSIFFIRKPLKIKFKEAVKGLNLKDVWVIGDNPITDILGAKRMGFKSILIGKKRSIIKPNFYAKNIEEALKIITNQTNKASQKR